MFRSFHKYLELPIKNLTYPKLNGTLSTVGLRKSDLRFYATNIKTGPENVVKRMPVSNLLSLKESIPETGKVQTEIPNPKPLPQRSSGSSNSNNGKKKLNLALYLSPIIAAALVYQLWNIYSKEEKTEVVSEIEKRRKKRKEWSTQKLPPTSENIPSEVPYLLIGGGTTSFSAFRSIKANDPSAQILIVANEPYYPYMRPPLSKELFYEADKTAVYNLKFKQWTGKERRLFYEHDDFYMDVEKLATSKNGGIAVARGWKVTRIDPQNRKVYLDDGKEISYGKCLIATGAKAKNLPIFENAKPEIKEKVTMYRNIFDFEELYDNIEEGAKSIAIIGGGFLGSELACALSRRGLSTGTTIHQIFREEGNMAHILPKYLSMWTTQKVKKEGVNVINNAEVTKVDIKNNKVQLILNNGKQVEADIVIVAVGVEPNTELAKTSNLEVDNTIGGFLVNSELEARANLFIAGDCASFYDESLGRRRIEHHDNAVVTGRLAGENMTANITGKTKSYWYQSMLWSDLGPEVGYEAVGVVDSKLPTFAVYAKPDKVQHLKELEKQSHPSKKEEKALEKLSQPSKKEEKALEKQSQSSLKEEKATDKSEEPEEDYIKGVIFYLKDDIIVGIVLWNIFSRMHIARQVLKERKTFDDLNEVAKLFDIYADA